MVYRIFNVLIMLFVGAMLQGQVLETVPDTADFSWAIDAPGGFLVCDGANPLKEKKVSDEHLAIAYDRTMFTINGMPTHTNTLYIEPVQGTVRYKGADYKGSMQANCAEHRCSLAYEPHAESTPSLDHRLYNVRVLLDEWPAGASQSNGTKKVWELKASGFKPSTLWPSDRAELSIRVAQGNFFINGKKMSVSRVEIVPTDGAITFDGNTYRGAFLLVKEQGVVYLMNSLDMEEYVFSVLRTESWPGWPLEINKVFAIACRSYAIAMIMRSRTSKLPYHIKNSNVHQTYTGHHENPVVQQAVEETRNIFLGYDGKPIIAMFDGCCGGIIPAKIKGFNFTGAPYLARPYACTFCKSCKLYSWQAEYDTEELLRYFKKRVPHLKKVRDVKVSKKDKAGLVQEVSIKGARGNATLSGKKVYSLLKDVKSYCFTVHKNANDIIFKGRGYGHHLGLCQWGAREMVRQGKSYREVLQFYYPGTQFMTLS